ncbi:MAG: DUF502 domain-containing protein [Calditrichaeota bacterium]|nr:DUF502 domain-containing protein [Calditrichota bacterium]MCB9391415.1 DUF502 domain-containing protein [Calditrichota bacterium]
MKKTKLPESRFRKFRRAFATGLLVLSPIWLTGYIILIIIRILGGVLSPYLRFFALEVLELEALPKSIELLTDIVAFVLTALLITVIGFIVQRVLGKRLFDLIDRLLSRIPVVSDLYNAVRKLLEAFFGDKTGFRGVVATRFPNETSWAIAFVTGESALLGEKGKTIHIFLPTTPNPTSGYLLLVQESDVIKLDLTTDEAFKLIVSGGAIPPERFAKQ